MSQDKILITFVIPVKHFSHIKSMSSFKKSFLQTVGSLNNQSNYDWQCKVVVNDGMELPVLNENFEVVYVDYPPNPFYDLEVNDRELCYEAIREDKGKKVLAGILKAKNSKYLMVVDDDDFIEKSIVEFITKNDNGFGWYVQRGYIWYEGTPFFFKRNDFHHLCGTSLIVNRDLLEIEKNKHNLEFIKTYLGSHTSLQKRMNELGSPLAPIPFYAAVYRMGHAEAHSKPLQSKLALLKLLIRYKFKFTFLNSFLRKSFSLPKDHCIKYNNKM